MKKILLLAILAVVGMGLFRYVNNRTLQETRQIQSAALSPAQPANSVSDRLAYSLLLRLISTLSSDQNTLQRRAYVNRIGFENESDGRALLTVAAQFNARISALDAEIKAIKQSTNLHDSTSDRSAGNALKQLRVDYETATDDSIKSLFGQLSHDGAAKLRDFMDRSFKPKVKLRSESGIRL